MLFRSTNYEKYISQMRSLSEDLEKVYNNAEDAYEEYKGISRRVGKVDASLTQMKQLVEGDEKMKFKDYSGKYETCHDASQHCEVFGGNCASFMYRYPGNHVIENKPEDYIEFCTNSPLQEKEEQHCQN